MSVYLYKVQIKTGIICTHWVGDILGKFGKMDHMATNSNKVQGSQ